MITAAVCASELRPIQEKDLECCVQKQLRLVRYENISSSLHHLRLLNITKPLHGLRDIYRHRAQRGGIAEAGD